MQSVQVKSMVALQRGIYVLCLQAVSWLAEYMHGQQARAQLITSSALSGTGARCEAARCTEGRQRQLLMAIALHISIGGGELLKTGLMHGSCMHARCQDGYTRGYVISLVISMPAPAT